jgi:hypothetical protein
MSWPSVMVVRLRNTDMSTTTQQTKGRQYIVALTRHARTWDAAAFLLGAAGAAFIIRGAGGNPHAISPEDGPWPRRFVFAERQRTKSRP